MATRINPALFGVPLTYRQFAQAVADRFCDWERARWAVDEMLLHPAEATAFCQRVRDSHRWEKLPDSVIPRTLMNIRKGSLKEISVA
jgi:hypothetical protein